ncbi:hypothetical protein GDO86_005301, partial [Hymenochirus boettgeri]
MGTVQLYRKVRWQVICLFLFLGLCHSVSSQLNYSIFEELRKDSVISNIAKDLRLGIKDILPRKFRIVSRISEKYFALDLGNGNLYVKDRIDRETLCGSAAICFLTFDAMVANPINVFTVKIEVEDINDNSPSFFNEAVTLEMVELTLPGTRFVLQTAEDPDIGINSVQSYQLNDNQYFTLSERTSNDGSKFPELVLEKSLDREAQSVIELILTAYDGGNPVRSGTILIRIDITDANDNFPVFTQEIYKLSVRENIPVNSTILTVSASDRDEDLNAQITYSFSKATNNALQMFSIHPTTGEITINKHLDYELTKMYEMFVQAKDGGGLVAHSKVLIEVIDENDNAPEIAIVSLSSPIPEDSAPGTVIALIEVLDPDSEENGHVDCFITDAPNFDLISTSERFYRIITTKALDRESSTFHNITILVTDRGYPKLTSRKHIVLDISDVNDNPPIFSKSTYDAFVLENNLPGASIYSIHAKDHDFGENAKVIYSIYNARTEDLAISSYLSINIETGVLYAQRSFDYEQHNKFSIQIMATDNGSPSLSSNITLVINIVDENDNAPTILYPSLDNSGSGLFEMVKFASESGSLVTKVVAVDADSGHNSWLSYHILQMSESSPFSIGQHSGEIRTSRMFHEKDILKYKLVVMVKDNGQPTLSATVTLSLVVADHFQQVFPKLINKFKDEESQSNIQFYLIIALALICFLFLITLLLAIMSKCKESKSSPTFSTSGAHLYSDPRFLPNYTSSLNGTLPFSHSYNVCVALDSSESEFTFLKANQTVPIDNLIDAEDSELGNEK